MEQVSKGGRHKVDWTIQENVKWKQNISKIFSNYIEAHTHYCADILQMWGKVGKFSQPDK